MPKWLLYGLGALVDFTFAVIAYVNDRVVIAAIFALAGILFVIAALGSLRQTKSGSSETS
jgi:hypothetical protein